ncbi:nucleotidyl transferase, PF08843 domain protein [Olsenella profusa F0195]|uniref:Nucleotidyl transferase, PF08843 domain protein n=2 Tax=Olsenella profusa TaxID=138595 RepID=U2TYL6_9ACTN|nr:nucleotidyl transferase, PF08843 domain protein [Olsenella profusa F0195]
MLDSSVHLMSHPLETVLAEKLETVVSRGVTTTRPRDFYDVHFYGGPRATPAACRHCVRR